MNRTRLLVTTVVDRHNVEGVKKLEQNCRLLNLDLQVLVDTNPCYNSNRRKDVILANFVKHLSDDVVVLFTDALDTVLRWNAKEYLGRFEVFNKDIVFSSDSAMFPLVQSIKDTYPHKTFANVGGFLAKALALKKVYSTFRPLEDFTDADFNWSNQYWWHHIIALDKAETFAIDSEETIFYLFANASEYDHTLETAAKELSKLKEIGHKYGHIHYTGNLSKIIFDHLTVEDMVNLTF